MTEITKTNANTESRPKDDRRLNGLNEIPFEVLEAFYQFEHFIVLGHQKPDADCATSQLAMSMALRRLGKSVQLVSAGPFLRPEIVEFADHFHSKIDREQIQQYGQDRTLAIIMDCSTTERTYFAQDLNDLSILIIDHHASGEIDGDFCYCDPQAPSTSMLVHNILLQLPLFLFQMAPQKYDGLMTDDLHGLLIDRKVANILFLGFATDTGFFRFLKPDNAGDMLRMVSALVDTKIDLQSIYQQMTGGKLRGTRRMLGLLLLRAGFLLDGRLCVSYGLCEDKKFWEIESNDSDSFYALSLATQNCEVILLLDEAEEGLWNVGFRSLKQHDVGSIAAQFGGGGHKNAAGCRIEAPEPGRALELLLAKLSTLPGLSIQHSEEVREYIASVPKFQMG
ncbi:DHH family phosphoesterase [Candidatus Haliotispira prima]|uniref:DHH family phosphoesterase n=1 Tax=Candidatus Haliotispira prima TaxID=3034016 RepID=A0ABY8MEX6_9SPIO|nr:DHH family phosphoesterase [Candidatus Haliotispira prima]